MTPGVRHFTLDRTIAEHIAAQHRLRKWLVHAPADRIELRIVDRLRSVHGTPVIARMADHADQIIVSQLRVGALLM